MRQPLYFVAYNTRTGEKYTEVWGYTENKVIGVDEFGKKTKVLLGDVAFFDEVIIL